MITLHNLTLEKTNHGFPTLTVILKNDDRFEIVTRTIVGDDPFEAANKLQSMAKQIRDTVTNG